METRAGLDEFVKYGELAETTTQLLALDLQHGARTGLSSHGRSRSSGDDHVKRFVLQKARDYLVEAREGFVLSVRTGQVADGAELRFLLDRVLTDWRALSKELGFDDGPTDANADDHTMTHIEFDRIRNQLLAFGMAAVALGQLPRLPADQVTFPWSHGKPPTYADIDAPSSPGAMLTRLEEAAQMLWQVMAGDVQDLVKYRYAPLRRTYGFFEASARLTKRESARFGIQPKPGSVDLLL